MFLYIIVSVAAPLKRRLINDSTVERTYGSAELPKRQPATFTTGSNVPLQFDKTKQ